jgi:hypothetical protein
MRLQATTLSRRAPTFAQCVLRRAKNRRGARPLLRNLPLIEQPRVCVDHALRKPNVRLNVTPTLGGSALFQTLELLVRECVSA